MCESLKPEYKYSNYKKEHKMWLHMLDRVFNKEIHDIHPTYENVTCCEEWLKFENFCEWVISQTNYQQWKDNMRWDLDKDILLKGNLIYSPSTCCLVPNRVNKLFTKRQNHRGIYPIGVRKRNQKYEARCNFDGHSEYLGVFNTVQEAFQSYKEYKEKIIKIIAQEEYAKGNITKQCYEAMMNYTVEITD